MQLCLLGSIEIKHFCKKNPSCHPVINLPAWTLQRFRGRCFNLTHSNIVGSKTSETLLIGEVWLECHSEGVVRDIKFFHNLGARGTMFLLPTKHTFNIATRLDLQKDSEKPHLTTVTCGITNAWVFQLLGAQMQLNGAPGKPVPWYS